MCFLLLVIYLFILFNVPSENTIKIQIQVILIIQGCNKIKYWLNHLSVVFYYYYYYYYYFFIIIQVSSQNKIKYKIQVIFNHSGCNKIKILSEPLKKCVFLLLFIYLFYSGGLLKIQINKNTSNI